MQSGATDYTLDPAQAASVADRFVTVLGGDLGAPVEAILAAQQEALFSAMADVGPMPFHPFVDGDVLASRPIEALPSSDVDLLIGTTRDEMRMYLDPNAPPLDRERLVKRTARYLSTLGVPDGHAEALLAHYDDDPYLPSPDEVWSAIQTDREMRRPMHGLADAHTRSGRSTYVYRFDEPLAGPLTHLRACHASDLPFTFGTVVDAGWSDVVGPGAEAVVRSMQAAWTAFARGGDPSCEPLGAWPAYDTDRRATMLLAAGSRLVDDPEGARRRQWAELTPMRTG